MLNLRLAAMVIGCLVALTSCHALRTAPAIDAELAACVPEDAVAIAGLNLEQLRASPLYGSGMHGPKELDNASYLLIAFNGKDLLLAARGQFREVPAGATRLTPTLVVAGSADAVRAATARHGGRSSNGLLDAADAIARGKALWIVAQGGVTLPVTGNAVNLNRMLRFTDHVTLTAQVGQQVEIDATGVCRNSEDSQHLEESLRAFITFAGAAGGGASLKSPAISREDRTVHARLSITLKSAEELLKGVPGFLP